MGDGSADKPIVPRGYAENTIKTTVGPNASKEEPPDTAGPADPAEDVSGEGDAPAVDKTDVDKTPVEEASAVEEKVAAPDETDTEDSA